MSSCFLYKITNLVNNKLYIGITSRPETRRKEHLYGKRRGTISLIKQAVLKYGAENFKFQIICEGTREYIVDLEMKAIALYDTINTGYNIRAGGEDQGSGHKFDKKSNDIPLFVTGFWFPNRRTCLDKLHLDPKTIYSWRDSGMLGEIQHLAKDSVATKSVYMAGFWFDCFSRIEDLLNISTAAIRKRIRDGNVEQKDNHVYKTGEDNHMTGRTGFGHHRSKAVKIEGIIYGSILEAARNTSYTKKMIYTRLKNNTPEFSWVT